MAELRRVVFFGSPDFALPTLEALWSSAYRPLRIVSQPPRRAGRGRKPTDPPVARWATAHDVGVVQPRKVGAPCFVDWLAALTPDVAIVVAFGQIFPQRLLEVPRCGCINLHASLLPKYRGAAPIQAAIAAGERETGVTTMLMEAGLDSGPILLQRRTAIAAEETAPELAARLAEMGARLVVDTLEGLEHGSVHPRPQDDEAATYAPRLVKEDGWVDWTLSAEQIERLSRALQPWPGLTCLCRGEPLKIHRVRRLERDAGVHAEPGTFLGVENRALAVATGDGVLGLIEVQRPGKKVLGALDFEHGEQLERGSVEFAAPASGS